MVEDLTRLLQELKDLTQASREPGGISRKQLESEVKRITGEIQQALSALSTQLQQPGVPPETAYLVEVFRSQIRMVLEQSGLTSDQIEGEDSEELSEDLKKLKRGGSIRT